MPQFPPKLRECPLCREYGFDLTDPDISLEELLMIARAALQEHTRRIEEKLGHGPVVGDRA